MLYDLIIDDDLRDWLPGTPSIVDADLETQLLADGGPLDPITVWKGKKVIVDGHRRYGICKKHKLKYQVREREFATIRDAKDWMDSYQASRRNMDARQLAEIRVRRVQYAKTKKGLSVGQAISQVAAEEGVDKRTIYRDINYVDALNSLPADIKNAIRKNEVQATRKDVCALANLDEVQQRDVFRQVQKGEFADLSACLHGNESQNNVEDEEDWDEEPEFCDTVSQVTEAPESVQEAGSSAKVSEQAPKANETPGRTAKPPLDLVKAAIQRLGEFARSVDNLRPLNASRYRDLRGYIEDMGRVFEAWSKEVE